MSAVTRYIIIGAGAIGVTLAAELQRAGKDILVIARGGQLDALRAGTLRYARPDGTRDLAIPAAAGPDEVTLAEGDVLIVATKTQDADAVLADWAWRPVASAGGRPAAAVIPVITVQNGLDAERSALRRFETVLGAVLWVAAGYVAGGEVAAVSWPSPGIIWLGSYPRGEHPLLAPVAADLSAAGFLTHVVPEVQRWKAAKLTRSVTFALHALYPPGPLRERAEQLLHDEAREILAASGLDIADPAAGTEGERDRVAPHPTQGPRYTGNSTAQSLTRASGVETDFLNGEIVLAARLAGRSAPANAALAERVHRALRDGTAAGSLDDADLTATLPQLAGQPGDPERDARDRSDVLIDAITLRKLLDAPDPPLVLDVRWALGDSRGREHYRDGHIPSAVYADLDTQLAAPPTREGGRHPLPAVADLQQAARSWGLRAGQPVVVYDDNGGLAAARAWWLLRWAGLTEVRILDGALGAWRSAGFELQAGQQHAAAGNVILTAGQLAVLSADDAAVLAGGDGVLLDARAGERYRGEIEPVDSRAGHIPGAASAPTADNLEPDGLFAGAEALRTRFSRLGAVPGAVVGVYCGSGVTAAHEIAALRIAGVEAALYPGSWSAWSADDRRPVATGPQPGPAREDATAEATKKTAEATEKGDARP